MPFEPSVTSASPGPWWCTLRYLSALLPKISARPGPKSVRAATNCSGVEVVVSWKWMVAMSAPLRGGDALDAARRRREDEREATGPGREPQDDAGSATRLRVLHGSRRHRAGARPRGPRAGRV